MQWTKVILLTLFSINFLLSFSLARAQGEDFPREVKPLSHPPNKLDASPDSQTPHQGLFSNNLTNSNNTHNDARALDKATITQKDNQCRALDDPRGSINKLSSDVNDATRELDRLNLNGTLEKNLSSPGVSSAPTQAPAPQPSRPNFYNVPPQLQAPAPLIMTPTPYVPAKVNAEAGTGGAGAGGVVK